MNTSRVVIAATDALSGSTGRSRIASIVAAERSASISFLASREPRWRTFLLAGLVLGAVLFLPQAPATAASPCRSITVDNDTRVKVATVGVSCQFGRTIAKRYFERVLNGERFDGKAEDGSVYYVIKSFRCFSGLAGTQMFCRRHNHSAFASSRPGDRPATWG